MASDIHNFQTRFINTLKSASERGIIPDSRQLPDFWFKTFVDSLTLVLKERQPNQEPIDEGTVFTDEELKRAWQYLSGTIKQLENEQSSPISPYEFAKQQMLQKHRDEHERRLVEEGMWDAYVQLGKLPSPKQLESNSTLQGLFIEESEKAIEQSPRLDEYLPIDCAVEAWEEAKRRYSQHLIEQSKKAMGIGAEIANGKPAKAISKPREKRWMNANTEAKVREAHRLLNAGTKWVVVKNTCAYETYMMWCETVTGEKPVTKL